MALRLSCTAAAVFCLAQALCLLLFSTAAGQALSTGSNSCPPLQNSPSNNWIIIQMTRKTEFPNGQLLTATIRCKEGFHIHSGSHYATLKVTCRDGKWTNMSMRCSPKERYHSRRSTSCNSNAIQNGKIRGSPRIVSVNQTHARLECPISHHVNMLSDESGQLIRQFYFQCVDGEWQSPYDKIPKNRLDCSWVTCPIPSVSRLFNVRLLRKGNATTYGVGCLLGYRCKTANGRPIQNQETIARCLPSGQWSKDRYDLSCNQTFHTCGHPNRFHGYRIDYHVNETHARVECPKGYHAVPRGLAVDPGKRTFFIRCENGVWDSPYVGTDIGDLRCKQTLCDPSKLVVSNIESVRMCMNVTVPNAVGDCIRYSCTSKGYYLIDGGDGSVTIHCLENGEWSQNPEHFQCKPSVFCNASELLQPEFVRKPACLEADRKYGPGYCEDFVCKRKGHYINGHKKMTVHCLQNGTWSQDPSTLHCRECGQLYRQFRVSPRIDYGFNATHIIVECPRNHHVVPRLDFTDELSKSFYFKCVGGAWASPYNGVLENELDCSRTYCDPPSTSRDFNQVLRCPTNQMYSVGCYVDYTCRRRGRQITGNRSASIECLENGKWSGDPTKFQCQKCGPIRTIGGPPVINYVNKTHALVTCPLTHRVTPQRSQSEDRDPFRSFYLKCERGTWTSPYKGVEYHELDCQRVFCDNSSLSPENIDIKPCIANQSPMFSVGYCLEGICHKDYYLSTNGKTQDKITCLSNGKWNQDISHFKCRGCGPVTGRFRSNPRVHYSVNATHAFIQCPDKHHVAPLSLDDKEKTSFYLQCYKGDWKSPFKGVTSQELDCSPTTCDVSLIHPSTATCPPGQSQFTPGCIVRHRCKDTRHYINGRSKLNIHCLSNGQWNRDPSRLYCRKCGPVPALDGPPTVDYRVNQTHVLVNCPPTHHAIPQRIRTGSSELFGSFYLKCVDGQWTSPYKEVSTKQLGCRPIICNISSLSRRNADIKTCGENQCREYQCHNNYRLITSGKLLGKIYCLPSGKWSQDPILFQCHECGPITRQFRVAPIIDYNMNATHALVRCPESHHSLPLHLPHTDKKSFYFKCVAGNWESPYPGVEEHQLDCLETTCEMSVIHKVDRNTINAQVTCPDNRTGGRVGCSAHFSCRKQGYHLNGQSDVTIHCLANGQWSLNPEQLLCRRCDPIPFLTGSRAIDYTVNETHVHVICPETQQAVLASGGILTSFYLVCVHGQWTSPYNGTNNPHCQPKRSCSFPRLYPHNVRILSSNISSSNQQNVQSTLMWGCKDGYKSEANNSFYILTQRCNTASGQWEPRIESEDLQSLCRPVRHCDSGVFNAVARKDMIATGSCEFADVYAPGYCADIRCYHRGYLIEGNQTYRVRCQVDGTWDRNPEVLQCAPKNACPHPLTEKHPGDIELTSSVPLDQQPVMKIAWKCIANKLPESGSKKFIQRCNAETGNWEPSLDLMPRCVARIRNNSCSLPVQRPENASLDEERSTRRHLVWRCIGGYEITQECIKGEWEPAITSCQKKICSQLPPQHGNVIVPSSKVFHPGDKVMLQCKPDNTQPHSQWFKFKPKGEPRLVCNETGHWNFTEEKAYTCRKSQSNFKLSPHHERMRNRCVSLAYSYCSVRSIPASVYERTRESYYVPAGTIITLKSCPPGEYRPESHQLQCRLNTRFDKQWKPCRKTITCPRPSLTSACQFDQPLQDGRQSYDQGTQLRYTMNTMNKRKAGQGTITCGGDGKWKYKHTKCDLGDKKGFLLAKT